MPITRSLYASKVTSMFSCYWPIPMSTLSMPSWSKSSSSILSLFPLRSQPDNFNLNLYPHFNASLLILATIYASKHAAIQLHLMLCFQSLALSSFCFRFWSNSQTHKGQIANGFFLLFLFLQALAPTALWKGVLHLHVPSCWCLAPRKTSARRILSILFLRGNLCEGIKDWILKCVVECLCGDFMWVGGFLGIGWLFFFSFVFNLYTPQCISFFKPLVDWWWVFSFWVIYMHQNR